MLEKQCTRTVPSTQMHGSKRCKAGTARQEWMTIEGKGDHGGSFRNKKKLLRIICRACVSHAAGLCPNCVFAVVDQARKCQQLLPQCVLDADVALQAVITAVVNAARSQWWAARCLRGSVVALLSALVPFTPFIGIRLASGLLVAGATDIRAGHR